MSANRRPKRGFSFAKLGTFDEKEIASFLSKQYGVPAVNLTDFQPGREVLSLIPPDQALRDQMLPINREKTTLVVAMSDPSNVIAIDDLKFRTGLNVEICVAGPRSLEKAIQRYYFPN